MRLGQVAVAAFALTALASPAPAADRSQILVLNTVVQGTVTVVSAAVQGHIHSRRDVVRRFASGSASGFGMYEAKVLAGHGHTTGGWLLANAAGSLSENAVAGRHPLAQIGYSIGPLRIRFSLPTFDPRSDAHAHVDLSAYETFALLVAIAQNDRAGVRGGMLVFRRNSPYDGGLKNAGSGIAIGGTAGIFPGVISDTGFGETFENHAIWGHETVHAIQSLQGDVLEPSFAFLSREPAAPGARKRPLRFGSVKAGVANFSNDLLFGEQRYGNRWVEIEAYRLANDQRPPH